MKSNRGREVSVENEQANGEQEIQQDAAAEQESAPEAGAEATEEVIEAGESGDQSKDWKAEAEALASKPSGARFRKDRPSYAEMAKAVKEQRRFDFGDRDQLIDCFCGDAE